MQGFQGVGRRAYARAVSDEPFFPPPKETSAYRDPDPPKVVDAPPPKKRSLADEDPMPLQGKPAAEGRELRRSREVEEPGLEDDRSASFWRWLSRRPRIAGLLFGLPSAWFLWRNFEMLFHGGRYLVGSSIFEGPSACGGLYLVLFGLRADAWGLPTEGSKRGFYSAIGVGLVVGVILEMKLRGTIGPR
jgi:hypothetical protein